MTTTTIELSSARRKLTSALGEERRALYLAHLKRWFRKMCSKEAFDNEARRLLPDNLIHLHNNFLLAILNKCQTLAHANDNRGKNGANAVLGSNSNANAINGARPPPKSRRKLNNNSSTTNSSVNLSGLTGTKQGLETLLPLLSAPQADVLADVVDGRTQARQMGALCFVHRDQLLPDAALMQGRFLVTAWEEGLESVGNNVVPLVLTAMEQLLKGIVSRLVMRRKGYKCRDKCWPHAMGAKVSNPWLINSNRLRGGQRQVTEVVVNAANPLAQEDPLAPVVPGVREDAEREALMELVCSRSSVPSSLPTSPVSVFELFEVMHEERRTLIPSHSVHAINMERVMARLHHEGYED